MSGHAHDEAVSAAVERLADAAAITTFCDERCAVLRSDVRVVLAALARFTVDTPGQPGQATADSGGTADAAASGTAPSLREQHDRVMAAIRRTGIKDTESREGWRDDEGREWEYRLARVVECPVCCFTFGAEHTTPGAGGLFDTPEGYECPVCADAAGGLLEEALRAVGLMLAQAETVTEYERILPVVDAALAGVETGPGKDSGLAGAE